MGCVNCKAIKKAEDKQQPVLQLEVPQKKSTCLKISTCKERPVEKALKAKDGVVKAQSTAGKSTTPFIP